MLAFWPIARTIKENTTIIRQGVSILRIAGASDNTVKSKRILKDSTRSSPWLSSVPVPISRPYPVMESFSLNYKIIIKNQE